MFLLRDLDGLGDDGGGQRPQRRAGARELYRRFTGSLSETGVPGLVEDLGEVAVLAVVRAFPSWRNCAALAWHTLVAALEGRRSLVLGSATTA